MENNNDEKTAKIYDCATAADIIMGHKTATAATETAASGSNSSSNNNKSAAKSIHSDKKGVNKKLSKKRVKKEHGFFLN